MENNIIFLIALVVTTVALIGLRTMYDKVQKYNALESKLGSKYIQMILEDR